MTLLMEPKESAEMSDNPPHLNQLSFMEDLDIYDGLPCLAICTLTSDKLRDQLQGEDDLSGILIGSLNTENIGIEQIVTYIVNNPAIRYLILCGEDKDQAIGSYPGQSFLALAENGIDADGKIIGAKGKRAEIVNIPPEMIEHFRNNVTLIDLVGNTKVPDVMAAFEQCIADNPGAGEPFTEVQADTILKGYKFDQIVMDSFGYFVIKVDHVRGLIVLDHYTKTGKKNMTIEGATASHVYHPTIHRGLLSRMDHAAYLGKELARAEEALRLETEYIQDALG